MSQATIDLSACDRELIHVPGSVQPHGILLVIDPRSLLILQVAGETDRIFGRRIDTVCDHTVAEVLGMHAAALVDTAQTILEPIYLGSVAIAGATLCLTAHDRDGIRILEIEPSSPLPQCAAEVLAQARRTAALFDRALDQTELLQTAAREARRLTGFGRVMIYKFLRDGSGSVAAEDRAGGPRHSSTTGIPRPTFPSKRGRFT